jgi:hypothetical protein
VHWRSKIGRDDLVLVDRPGRGYGDDYSPWLVPESAPVGELLGVRAAGVSEEGILAAYRRRLDGGGHRAEVPTVPVPEGND